MSPPELRRPRRFRPVFVILCVVLVVLIAGCAFLALRFQQLRQSAIQTAVSALEKSLRARITYRATSGDLRHQLNIDDLAVDLPSGDSFRIARVGVDYNLWQLLRRNYVISNLELLSPRVFIAPQRPPGGPAGGRLAFAVGTIRVRNGGVWYGNALEADSIALQFSLNIDSLRTAVRLHDGAVFVPACTAAVRSLSGEFTVQRSDIRVDSLMVRLNRTRARLSLHADLADSLFDLDLDDLTLDATDLPSLPALRNLNATGRLSARGKLRVRLMPDRPRATGRLEFNAQRVGIKGYAAGPVEGSLEFTGSRAEMSMVVRDTSLGTVKASGGLDLSTWDYSVRADLSEFAPARLDQLKSAGFLPQTVTGEIAVSGRRLDRADALLDARVTGLPFDTVSLVANYEPTRLLLNRLEVRRSGPVPQVLRAKGTFSRTELDAVIELDLFPAGVVESLLTPGRPGIANDVRVSGSVQARGSYAHPAVKADLTSESGRVRDFRYTRLTARLDLPDIRRLDGRLDVQVAYPALGATSFRRFELGIAQQSFTVALRKDEQLSFASAGSWSLRNQSLVVECSTLTARNGGNTLSASRPFAVRAEPGRFALEGFEAAFVGGMVELDAMSTGAGLPEVRARATGLDMNLVGRLFLNTDSLHGKVDIAVNRGDSGAANGNSTGADWQYVAAISATDIGYGAYKLELDRVFGGLKMSAHELFFDNLRMAHGRDTSSISGSVGYRTRPKLEPTALNVHAIIANPGPWALDFLRGSVNLEKGSIYGDVTITGTFDQPQMSGAVRLFNGEIWIPGINQRLTEVTVQTLLYQNRLNFAKLSGASGDGSAIATGYVEFEGFRRISDLQLNVHASNIEMHPLPDIVGIASGDVKLHWADHEPFTVTGAVEVSEALVAMEFGSPSLSGAPSSAADTLRMDLTIKAERNVWIRNRLLDLELAGDFNIRKPGRDFLLSGELTTRQGRVYAFDHSFRVTTGAVRFDNPGRPDPSLDIVAELPTRIRDSTSGTSQNVKIVATVSGTATQPVLTLSSDPAGMAQADIATYLATNILPEELASLKDRAVLGHLVSDRLLSLLSREVTSRLQSYLQLDVLELQTPTTGGGLKLTVSKYIGKNLFVSYTASTTQLEPDAFKAEYFFSPGREIIGERQESGTYSLRYQFRLRY